MFEVMQEQGLLPDVITYNALISACSQGGQLERALQLLNLLQAQGLEPDVVTYNMLISLCFKRGKTPLGYHLFDAMSASGLRPDDVTYKIMQRGAQAQQQDGADQWPEAP